MKPLLLTAALPAALLGGCADRAAAPAQPNILFIYADDLGIGDLSC